MSALRTRLARRQDSCGIGRALRQRQPAPAGTSNTALRNVREVNGGARRLFTWLLGAVADPPFGNLVRSVFEPTGLRPHLQNWSEVARSIVQRVRAEAVAGVVDGSP